MASIGHHALELANGRARELFHAVRIVMTKGRVRRSRCLWPLSLGLCKCGRNGKLDWPQFTSIWAPILVRRPLIVWREHQSETPASRVVSSSDSCQSAGFSPAIGDAVARLKQEPPISQIDVEFITHSDGTVGVYYVVIRTCL